jgi:hypothetical protein
MGELSCKYGAECGGYAACDECQCCKSCGCECDDDLEGTRVMDALEDDDEF